VLALWANGINVSCRPSDTWIVDFGRALPEGKAALYEAQLHYALENEVRAQR
jgi:hypothetical protein